MANILLIEPDVLLAATLTAALEAAGHSVRCCPSAQAAVSAADAACPDAVILEIQLVSHNGLEFLYEFRSYPDWQRVPVIIHTHVAAGEFSGSWKLLTGELGVKAYLYKPRTSLQKLLRLVNESVPAGKAE